jgi:hypothetical protein
MSTEPTQNTAATPPPAASASETSSGVPKKIVNAQTVCNERNEKKKLCNGHLKQLQTGGEEAKKHLNGDDALFKCQTCGTLYMGPPLGHLRDPDKQDRFVERELTALLQAAGGTLPAIVKNEKGAYVLAEEAAPHAPAAKPAAAAPAKAAGEAAAAKAAAPAAAAKPAGAKAGHAIKVGPIKGADGPVPGETFEQKIARLKAVSAEAKRRAEAREAAEAAGETAPTTSGTDSSAEADRHRPAAEAQAATGMASAVPLSPAAATASPAAGAETVEDLAPDAVAGETQASASPPIPGADGPVPGETFEQKLERLRGVVAGARERAIREGRREG